MNRASERLGEGQRVKGGHTTELQEYDRPKLTILLQLALMFLSQTSRVLFLLKETLGSNARLNYIILFPKKEREGQLTL
ncbi:hypothetical protein chiPu_0010202 [Chiloscyllium punctatum]|uniref:Uncharacterized protein n=1 Tax=Chiloscyllium punctatum TaxID=137246 RepID=A0A401SMZ2_CHIPU|nr:hypothetical protein [Chiloscyllium punctatum]